MASVARLAGRDPRIAQVFDEAFANSPALAAFLTTRVRNMGGTVLVARLLVKHLTSLFRGVFPHVNKHVVDRFDIWPHQRSFPAMVEELLGGETLLRRAAILHTSIRGRVEIPPGATRVRDCTIRPRRGTHESLCEPVVYAFYCACAMLRNLRLPQPVAAAA